MFCIKKILGLFCGILLSIYKIIYLVNITSISHIIISTHSYENEYCYNVIVAYFVTCLALNLTINIHPFDKSM